MMWIKQDSCLLISPWINRSHNLWRMHLLSCWNVSDSSRSGLVSCNADELCVSICDFRQEIVNSFRWCALSLILCLVCYLLLQQESLCLVHVAYASLERIRLGQVRSCCDMWGFHLTLQSVRHPFCVPSLLQAHCKMSLLSAVAHVNTPWLSHWLCRG